MPYDETAYHNLERLFKAQIDSDKAHAIERVVRGWGVYLPCVQPESEVDYVIVGMEPSFGWADSIEDAEKKVQEGFRNFSLSGRELSGKESDTLSLFLLSIDRFLLQRGQTCHLTDVSKGAMPVSVAALDRDRRYEEWYPLLLEEIAIVGKPRRSGDRHRQAGGGISQGAWPATRDRQTSLRCSALFHASVRVLEEGSREGPREL